MATSVEFSQLFQQAQQLSRADQLLLVQKLEALLCQKEKVASVSANGLLALKGLGKKLWKSTEDIDRYLDEERQW